MSRTPCMILAPILILCLYGCLGSKLGSAKKSEKVAMAAPPKRDVINYAMLKSQQEKPLSMASRGSITSRGPVTAFTGGLVSFGVSAVKSVIANENKKYLAEWKQGLNDLYFYDQPSSDGPFDPTGMQFNGFTITRTFEDDHQLKTALVAEFEIEKDSVASNEIINDAIFRLKLKSIKINYAKAKVPYGRDTLNLDFNIIFTSSYISKNGTMFKDVELGRFLLTLRKAPLDSTKPGYQEYYDKLKNKKLDGKSFVVPRSYGYYKTPDNSVVSLYNQGMFSIAVDVVECSKNSFVNKMLLNTADIGLDVGQEIIMRNVKARFGSN